MSHADIAQDLELERWARNQQRRPLPDPALWDELSAHLCDACGSRIPDSRRRAVPGVRRCIACQRAAEGRT